MEYLVEKAEVYPHKFVLFSDKFPSFIKMKKGILSGPVTFHYLLCSLIIVKIEQIESLRFVREPQHRAKTWYQAKKQTEHELQEFAQPRWCKFHETFEGAKDMIAHGILENVDAALAFHVEPGKLPEGLFMYNSGGIMMSSVDGFKITVKGKGAHGAYPHSSIDPINIAVHIYLALEALIAREADPEKNCVLTIGNFSAGSAASIIPDTAVLQGTIRTNDASCRSLLVQRMKGVAKGTAQVLRRSC